MPKFSQGYRVKQRQKMRHPKFEDRLWFRWPKFRQLFVHKCWKEHGRKPTAGELSTEYWRVKPEIEKEILDGRGRQQAPPRWRWGY